MLFHYFGFLFTDNAIFLECSMRHCIPTPINNAPDRFSTLGIALLVGAMVSLNAHARVTQILIDEIKPVPTLGYAGIAYEQIAGRAFGEIDPANPKNALINDIDLAKDADGKVRYVATFVIDRPVDPKQSTGLMWHEVPNRGKKISGQVQNGDIDLISAWQGDNAGATTVRSTAGINLTHWLSVPIARQSNGKPITGNVLGRIVNQNGLGSQPLIVQSNPVPYKPNSLDTTASRLVSRASESSKGEVVGETVIPANEWAWARCDADHPFPGVADPTQICLKYGFNVHKLYQVVYPSDQAYVLGIGFAAWRDVGQFFKTAKADDAGHPNPIAGLVKYSIGRGISQSGNFLRGWLHLGFNQSETGSQVHDGMWPIIAGRRIALNFRWAQPDGVLELYQAGSEGPQWWLPNPDPVRGGSSAGILDRCSATKTCPKIIEHFGSAEVWALKLTPEWVGTDGKEDLPLPANVRRYYIASSNHGGGAGGFNSSLPNVGLPSTGAWCPGNNYGQGLYPANPVPHQETFNALQEHFRNWVMKGIEPPPSQWPRLADGTLVPANKTAMGFPSLPQIRPGAPEADFINPVLDYDWGPNFNAVDGSGIASNAPPPIKRVLAMFAPKVNADGNELGGVPVVLLEAPLGTYLGWNITAGGARPFHEHQICNYVGGMIPFAETAAKRKAHGDPRPSLEERYVNHAGYVAAVRKASAKVVKAGFLMQYDADRLIKEAELSRVLKTPAADK